MIDQTAPECQESPRRPRRRLSASVFQMQLNKLPERGRIHEWLITREQNHRVQLSGDGNGMLHTDSDRRAQPVRPVWVLDNRNWKPGQHRSHLYRTCDDHDRSASSVFCGRNNMPNEWFALKNRELLLAFRSGSNHRRRARPRLLSSATMRPLRRRSLV